MPTATNSSFIADLLHNLQVHPLSAYYTQCWPEWRELDYIPNYNKFYLICEGEGWIKIGEKEFYPTPGQMVLMPAHAKQSYSAISERCYRKYWCHFDATLGDMNLFQWLDTPYCLDVKKMPRLLALFQELVSLHANESLVARFREKAVLLEIIAGFLTEAEGAFKIVSGRNADLDRLESIERYIDDKLSEPVTLEQIARHVHLHPNYFVRYFKKYFAMSPLKYLNRKRMEKAKALLGTTSLSVKEIAERVGYAETNHFAKAFRRETSFSPSEYRMQVDNLD